MSSSQNHPILIIEDEKPIAKALEFKLLHAGFETRIVNNGKEALDLLKIEQFALVLLDLVMPYVDGFSVLEGMRKLHGMPPVIVMTNLSQPEDEKRVKELGAREFFIKSNTSLAAIVQRVKEYLG